MTSGSDLEPASALAERVYMLYGSPRAAKLIEVDRAAVREPLETQLDELRLRLHAQADVIAERDRRIGELETELDLAQRFAHGEGEGRKSWRNRATTAQERIAELEAQLASAVSPAWVLNQLAGHTFPGMGEAHDFMKACLRSERKEVR